MLARIRGKRKADATPLTTETVDQAKPETKAYIFADTRNGLYLRGYLSRLKTG